MFIDLKVFIYKYSLCLLLIEESSVNISQSFIGNSLYWLGSFILRLPLIQKRVSIFHLPPAVLRDVSELTIWKTNRYIQSLIRLSL